MRENEIQKLKSDLVETTKKLEQANSQIEQLKLKEEKLINDNRGMYIQMSTMATREKEIKELSSHVHQYLDVIMKKINCIEEKLDTVCTRHKLLYNQSNKGFGKKVDLQMKENHENHELSAYKESISWTERNTQRACNSSSSKFVRKWSRYVYIERFPATFKE